MMYMVSRIGSRDVVTFGFRSDLHCISYWMIGLGVTPDVSLVAPRVHEQVQPFPALSWRSRPWQTNAFKTFEEFYFETVKYNLTNPIDGHNLPNQELAYLNCLPLIARTVRA